MKNPMYSPSFYRLTPLSGADDRQTGFSLVELMIAITLGLIVLLAVGSIYIGSRQTYRVQEDNARIQEAGRYALEVIGRSIRQAGADAEMTFNPAAITQECGAPPPALACIAIDNNAVVAATDTIRNQFYAGREELNAGAWGARNCLGGVIAANALITNIFSLVGTELSCSTGAGVAAQPLVSDVEDLQVIYGIDITGDQSADRYVPAPTAAQWPLVVTARVCVGVRSANNGLTSAAQNYLNCEGALGNPTGGATTTLAGDRRLHRSFVATYNLRNRINGAI